jgi:negative regulator of flagellin synthesis FlgM
MKVGQTNDSLQADLISRTGARAPGGSTPAGGVAGSPDQTDKVELSQTSRQLTAAGTDLSSSKIAQVRQAIDKGEFRVDPQVVADRMINEAAELIERIAGAGSKRG